MTRHHVRHHMLAGALLATGALRAQTDVTFIDGGYAEMCSDVAKSIESPNAGVTLTGSRLDVPPIEICTRAIQSASILPLDLAASYNNRGVIEFHDKAYDAALRDFVKATSLKPELAAAHVNQGYVLMLQQKWGEALMAFDTGINLGPPDPAKAYYNRGLVHEEAGHVREAYFDYLKASELAPDWPEPKQELQRFQVKRKQ